MYITDHIRPVLLIKHLVNQYGEITMPHKLTNGMKPSVSNPHILFCPCVLQKSAAHVDTKALNIRHQSQKGLCGIFVGIPQHQKGCLVYVPSTHKIVFSYDVVYNKTFYSALEYTPHPYSEALTVQPAVSYIPHAK